jgi:tRNA modification GTPase
VLVSIFHSPNSYTGEDSVEISTHGNPLIVQKIIEILLKQKIRLAEPGEFTKRAFLNGKFDLTQAEAVADIIKSRNDSALKGARNQLNGLLSEEIKNIKKSLIEIISLLELELDFAEEDLQFISRNEIVSKIREIIRIFETLITSYRFGRILRDGVNIAIVGKPNVGKSSLLNYFVKENRAIVSEIPGTTRDVIIEEVNIEGILFKFYDTAGFRESDNEIETLGVEKSEKTILQADFVMLIHDVEQELDLQFYNRIVSLTEENRVLLVQNKIDKTIKKLNENEIGISAKTGEGIEKLFKHLMERIGQTKIYTENSLIITNLRHLEILTKGKNYLKNAIYALEINQSQEFISIEIRYTLEMLDEIIGVVTTDEILNNIFNKFCIGK